MNDSYMHIESNVMYIEESIPGPPETSKEYEELINAFNSQLTIFCTCIENCSSKCLCNIKSGGQNYISNDDSENLKFRLNYELKDFKTYSIIECNSLCLCSSLCGNRVVQHGPKDGLIIKTCKSRSKGLGLFTEFFISNGTFICEYAGEIITKTQALERQNKNEVDGNMNYIYCLSEHSKGKVVQTFVDPSQFGNIGRYMNHSCEANCVIIPVRVNSPIPKLAIFSCVDILPNSELTFDYGSYDLKNKENVSITDDIDNRKESEDNRKESIDNRKESVDNRKDSMYNRKESADDRKESIDNRKESIDNRKESMDIRKESIDDRKESIDNRKECLCNSHTCKRWMPYNNY